MSLYELIGIIFCIAALSAMVFGALSLAVKESKIRQQHDQKAMRLMDKIYRVLCAEYPDQEDSKNA